MRKAADGGFTGGEEGQCTADHLRRSAGASVYCRASNGRDPSAVFISADIAVLAAGRSCWDITLPDGISGLTPFIWKIF